MRCFLLLSVFLWSCTAAAPHGETTPSPDSPVAGTAAAPSAPAGNIDWEIVPGHRIGKTRLGDDPETLLQHLGTPDASDAAMGKAWLVWAGKNTDHTLAVFTTYADSTMRRKAIRQIRVTSSSFKTKEGIHPGSKLAEVQQVFPGVKAADLSLSEAAPRYDVASKGVSFEFSGRSGDAVCTAILVYPPGDAPTAYLPIPH